MLTESLERSEQDFTAASGTCGRRLGLTDTQVRKYLEGFNVRLGEREMEAMRVFRRLTEEVEAVRADQAEEKGR